MIKRKHLSASVPITTRALVQRINRALEKDHEVLKRSRGAEAMREFGDYFVVNFNMGAVVRVDVDLEDFGREIGVLEEFERLSKQG